VRRFVPVASLVLAAAAPPPVSVVTVVMVDDAFQPAHVTFQAGQDTELRLENHGREMHEFTAGAFFRSASVRDKRQLANGGIEVVVQPGRTVRLRLTPLVKGDYALTCADHDWDGMVGSITVE
jgi:plastocyanin